MTTVYVANKGFHNYPFDVYPASLDGKTMETVTLEKGNDGANRVKINQVLKTITCFGAYHESCGITYLEHTDWELIEKFYGKNHVLLKSGAIKCFKTVEEAEKYLKDPDTQLIDLGNNKLTEKDLTVIDDSKGPAYESSIKNQVAKK